jgi:predicted TIM-barrel fold metal-dependent hydrolase
MASRIDMHQHVWTEPLIEALGRRDSPPFARPANGRFVLYASGEAPATVAGGPNAVDCRLAELDRDGIDRAVVSLSCPIGVESLPRREAEPLLDAYEQGVAELPPCFEAWGAIALEEAGPEDVDRVLDAGFVGVSLPASALSGPREVERLGPVLDRLARRRAPLFVHPGPGLRRDGASAAQRDPGAPAWWPALTRYLFEMQSAWLVFLIEGRPAHAELRVVFAMLAGCAPLHRERLAGRGGPACMTVDQLFFYDCSSYGAQALDAMARCVGVEQIVFGSDRPVVEPTACHLGDAARHAIAVTNPARALAGLRVAA